MTDPLNNPCSNDAFSNDPIRYENLKDAISDFVRLLWVHEKGELLPCLPGDSKIHEPLTTQEMDFKNKSLAEIAKVIASIYEKDGGAL